MTEREWNAHAVLDADFAVTSGWPLDAVLVHREHRVLARVTGFELNGHRGFRLERLRDGRSFSVPARSVVSEWEYRDGRPEGAS